MVPPAGDERRRGAFERPRAGVITLAPLSNTGADPWHDAASAARPPRAAGLLRASDVLGRGRLPQAGGGDLPAHAGGPACGRTRPYTSATTRAGRARGAGRRHALGAGDHRLPQGARRSASRRRGHEPGRPARLHRGPQRREPTAVGPRPSPRSERPISPVLPRGSVARSARSASMPGMDIADSGERSATSRTSRPTASSSRTSPRCSRTARPGLCDRRAGQPYQARAGRRGGRGRIAGLHLRRRASRTSCKAGSFRFATRQAPGKTI